MRNWHLFNVACCLMVAESKSERERENLQSTNLYFIATCKYDRDTPIYAVLVLNQGLEHETIGLTDPL